METKVNESEERSAHHIINQKKTFQKYDFDVVLSEIGSLGKYQFFLVLAVYYGIIPSGMNQVASVFLSAIPEHRCWIPQIDNKIFRNFSNITNTNILKVSSPYDVTTKKYDGCRQYVFKENCTGENFERCFINETTICRNHYVYDKNVYKSTTTTEWNLVCDQLYLGTLATTIYFIGVFFGVIIGGNLGDRFGRTPVLIVGQVLTCIFCVICSFSPNFLSFTLSRFFIALFCQAATPPMFVYAIEIVGEKWRTLVGVGLQTGFAIGYMILSGLSYRWRDWRQLQLSMALFPVVYFVISIFVPESPRWLFSEGHIKKGKKISLRFAQKNGRKLSPDIWDRAVVKDKEAVPQTRLYPHVLFERVHMRKVTINILFCWFVASLVYYGLSLNVGSLAGDDRVNNLLGGVCEIASCLIVVATVDKFGRRPILSISFLVAGISCVLSTICNYFSSDIKALGILGTVLALVGKLAVSGSFAIVYNYTAELYPTVIRATAIGCGSMVARIGSLLSPVIILIQYSIPWFTGAVFGTFSFIAGLMVLLLPETNNVPLTTTLDDAEKFYRNAKRKDKSVKLSPTEEILLSNEI